MNKLRQWKKDNNMTYTALSAALKTERRWVIEVINRPTPHISYVMATKIKALTGLEPWDYIDEGLEDIRYLVNKNK